MDRSLRITSGIRNTVGVFRNDLRNAGLDLSTGTLSNANISIWTAIMNAGQFGDIVGLWLDRFDAASNDASIGVFFDLFAEIKPVVEELRAYFYRAESGKLLPIFLGEVNGKIVVRWWKLIKTIGTIVRLTLKIINYWKNREDDLISGRAKIG